MPKSVRFSPSVAPPTPLSPLNDAALIMLDLHHGTNNGSTISKKRKFSSSATYKRNEKQPPLVSPNEGDDARTSTRVLRDPSLPAPPFLDDDTPSTTMERDAKRIAPTIINPLDLLSTVSLHLAPDRPHTTNHPPSTSCIIDRQQPAPTNHHSKPPTQGFRTYPNGSSYLGHFVNSSRHGFGICRYPDNHIYTGLWSNGRRSGLGTMQYANGDSYEGLWKDDSRDVGVFYYADGVADVAVWNGNTVIYGVRWSRCRDCTWALMKGRIVKIGKDDALEIGRELDVSGVPVKMM